jgi:hypothetical protein
MTGSAEDWQNGEIATVANICGGLSGAIGDVCRIPRYLDWHRYWEADFCNKAFKFQRKWRFRTGQFDPNDCGF